MSREKLKLSVYKQKPQVAVSSATYALSESGKEKLSDKPHPTLLTSLHPIPMQEQVKSLTRISRIRRNNLIDALPSDLDYYGEELEDDYNSDGLSPHEIAGLNTQWPEKLIHDVPSDVSGAPNTQPPKVTPDKPAGQE